MEQRQITEEHQKDLRLTTPEDLLSHGEKTATNNKNSFELIQKKRIENTPFTIVTTEMGSFIAVGNHRLTIDQTVEDCENEIMTKSWELIEKLIGLIAEVVYTVKKSEEFAEADKMAAG